MNFSLRSHEIAALQEFDQLIMGADVSMGLVVEKLHGHPRRESDASGRAGSTQLRSRSRGQRFHTGRGERSSPASYRVSQISRQPQIRRFHEALDAH